MWKFEVFGLCALTAGLIFLLSPYSPSSYAIKSTLGENNGELELPEHINGCIAFHDLLWKNIAPRMEKENIKRKRKKERKIFIVAAYAYPDYNVVTMDALRWFGKKTYCWYWDKDWRPLGGPVESVTYPVFVVHCCRHPKAYYMSVSEHEDNIDQEFVPLIDRTSFQTPVYELSLCLSPMYGNGTKWLLLTEVIEHYKLQHVEHFYIYVKDVDDYSMRVLNSYVKSGEVETIVLRKDSRRTFQGVGVQDCLQRSRYQSRYVLFSDLDERIVTMDGTPLREFAVKKFAEDVNIRNIRFTTRYIARPTLPPNEYKGDETLRKHLPTLVFHNTCAVLPLGFTRKNIIDPRAVLEINVHDVVAYFSDYTLMDIDTSEAEIRHYREFDHWWFSSILPQLTRFGNFTLTYYPKHLMEPLYNNVKRRLDTVYLRNITTIDKNTTTT